MPLRAEVSEVHEWLPSEQNHCIRRLPGTDEKLPHDKEDDVVRYPAVCAFAVLRDAGLKRVPARGLILSPAPALPLPAANDRRAAAKTWDARRARPRCAIQRAWRHLLRKGRQDVRRGPGKPLHPDCVAAGRRQVGVRPDERRVRVQGRGRAPGAIQATVRNHGLPERRHLVRDRLGQRRCAAARPRDLFRRHPV